MDAGPLGRKTALVSAAAGASRILGFVRDVMLAAMLGSGPAADAFVVAFRIPSLVRRVLGEGALNAGIVPVLARIRRDEGVEAERWAAGEILSTAALALLVVTVLGQIAAPWLVLGLAGGFADDPVRLDLATLYTRLMLPLMLTAVLSGLAAAVLNAAGRVTAAALAPLAVNVILVAVLIALSFSLLDRPQLGMVLAGAVSVAGLVQLLLLVPALARMPDPPRWARPRVSPALRRAFAIGVPGLLVAAAAQIGIVVATQVASHEPSAVARLYFAERLFSLPLGFVAAAAGTVFLPEVARLVAAGQDDAAREAQNRALEWALLLAIPAALALAVLAGPIVSVLFEHGAFGREDARVTAACLAALAAGLPAAAVSRILSQAFFAREDVRTPVVATAAGVSATLAAAIVLEPVWGAPGVAAAVSVGTWAAAGLLQVGARRRGLHRPDARFMSRLPRILVAGVAMAALVAGLAELSAQLLAPQEHPIRRAGMLAVLCGSGIAAFGAMALISGAVTREDLRRLR